MTSATEAQPIDAAAQAPAANQLDKLAGPAHWLGAKNGYSGEDLTSLQVAYDCYEIARPDPNIRENEVLELRVHGVGGATAETNLETPTTMMVSGDQTAGFYRAWFPGQSSAGTPLREAYCWGKFSYATAISATWLVLLPFALVNLASWALPSPYRPHPNPEGSQDGQGATPVEVVKDSKWRGLRRLSRVLIRLLGLVFTVAFMSTTCYLLVDIVARQAVHDGKLPDWYEDISFARREAISLGVALLVVVALRLFSKVTTGDYEDWSPGDNLPPQPDDTDDTDTDTDTETETGTDEDGNDGKKLKRIRLAEPDMWRGSESVRRQQFCHVLAACALIIAFAGLAFGHGSWQVWVAAGIAAAMGLFAVAVLSVPGCDRTWIVKETRSKKGEVRRRTWALRPGLQSFLEGLTWAGTAVAIIYVGVANPPSQGAGYDFEGRLLHFPVLAEFVLLLALSVALVVQKPWKQEDVFARGLTSVLIAGLAVAISTIFGGALLITVTKLIGSSPSTLTTAATAQDKEKANIFVPGVVASGSLAFLVTTVTAAGVIAYLIRWHSMKKKAIAVRSESDVSSGPGPWLRDIPVAQEYKKEGLPTALPDDENKNRPPDPVPYDKVIGKVAGTWATSRMTDLVAVVGASLAFFTLLALLTAEIANLIEREWFNEHLLGYAQFGSTLTAAATLAFIGILRSALINTASRRKFAFFWDVVNFWPRAAHPFAPPCYAERVVPEVTTRIRRIVGDDEKRGGKDPAFGQVATEQDQALKRVGFEPHRPVVLNGYSQGSPISVAVMAQLPGTTHERVALLTLACPAHRLYGRAFPLYFGPDQLDRLLGQKLTTRRPGQKTKPDPEPIRWINMCRRSDYVGGPVGMGIDQWILDPPALWPDTNPIPVPTHLHSDWFPDPQTHPNVHELALRLPRLPDPDAEVKSPTKNPLRVPTEPSPPEQAESQAEWRTES